MLVVPGHGGSPSAHAPRARGHARHALGQPSACAAAGRPGPAPPASPASCQRPLSVTFRKQARLGSARTRQRLAFGIRSWGMGVQRPQAFGGSGRSGLKVPPIHLDRWNRPRRESPAFLASYGSRSRAVGISKAGGPSGTRASPWPSRRPRGAAAVRRARRPAVPGSAPPPAPTPWSRHDRRTAGGRRCRTARAAPARPDRPRQ